MAQLLCLQLASYILSMTNTPSSLSFPPLSMPSLFLLLLSSLYSLFPESFQHAIFHALRSHYILALFLSLSLSPSAHAYYIIYSLAATSILISTTFAAGFQKEK